MSAKPDISPVKSSAAVIIAALMGIYMLSQFFRNALGVLGPDLSREFDLDAASLGLLSSIFFLSFAAAQIPLGIALDRFGPKPAILVTALLMIGSTVFFALAQSFSQLTAARLLMGLGCCSFFMAPLALYAGRFPPEKFSTITGVHLGGGSLGMLAATAPLAWAAGQFGWRNVFLGAAAFATLMTLCVALFVHETPGVVARRRERAETLKASIAGVGRAMKTPGVWRLFFMQGASSSAFVVILGLWAGPWFAHVYGMPLEQRGHYTLIPAIAQIAGLFLWGASDRLFGGYRWPIVIGACMAICVLAFAALFPIPIGALPIFLILFGFSLAFTSVLTAHGKSLFPSDIVGRGLTLLNIGTMSGIFVQQFLTGLAIETFGSVLIRGARLYPPEAYRLVFGVLGAQLAVATLFYFFAPDPHAAIISRDRAAKPDV